MTKAMEEARAIARYDLDAGGFLGERGHMVPDATGEWVSYEDHTTALAARDAEIERLREALTEIDRRYRNGANADTLVLIARKAQIARTAGGQP